MSAGIWMVIIDEVWIVGRVQKVHLNEDSQDCKPVRLVCSILWRPILNEQGCKCKSRSNNLKFNVHFQQFQIKNGKFKPWCYSGQCVARRRTVFHQQCAHFRARRTSPSGRAFATPGEICMSFGSPLELNEFWISIGSEWVLDPHWKWILPWTVLVWLLQSDCCLQQGA